MRNWNNLQIVLALFAMSLGLFVQSGKAGGALPLRGHYQIEHLHTKTVRDGYQACAQMVVYGWPALRGKVLTIQHFVQQLTQHGYCFYRNSGGEQDNISSYWFQCAVITWDGGTQVHPDRKDVLCAEAMLHDYGMFLVWANKKAI